MVTSIRTRSIQARIATVCFSSHCPPQVLSRGAFLSGATAPAHRRSRLTRAVIYPAGRATPGCFEPTGTPNLARLNLFRIGVLLTQLVSERHLAGTIHSVWHYLKISGHSHPPPIGNGNGLTLSEPLDLGYCSIIGGLFFSGFLNCCRVSSVERGEMLPSVIGVPCGLFSAQPRSTGYTTPKVAEREAEASEAEQHHRPGRGFGNHREDAGDAWLVERGKARSGGDGDG